VTSVVHDRMPVILAPNGYDLWLDPGMKDVGSASGLLKPCDARLMRRYPESTRINHVGMLTQTVLHPSNSRRFRIGSSSSGHARLAASWLPRSMGQALQLARGVWTCGAGFAPTPNRIVHLKSTRKNARLSLRGEVFPVAAFSPLPAPF
jgi:hypothetical protein